MYTRHMLADFTTQTDAVALRVLFVLRHWRVKAQSLVYNLQSGSNCNQWFDVGDTRGDKSVHWKTAQ